MVNRVILAGHCTRDTIAIATQGKPMARVRLATNSVWRDANGDRQEAARQMKSSISAGLGAGAPIQVSSPIRMPVMSD